MRNGARAFVTAQRSGVVCKGEASKAPCVSSVSGQHGDDGPRRLAINNCKIPSARTISRLMTTARDNLGKADAVTIAAIEARVPTLVEARTLVERLQAMVRKKLVECGATITMGIPRQSGHLLQNLGEALRLAVGRHRNAVSATGKAMIAEVAGNEAAGSEASAPAPTSAKLDDLHWSRRNQRRERYAESFSCRRSACRRDRLRRGSARA